MVVEIAAAVCALALVLALALWSVRIVQTGQSVLVERLGRYTRTLGAGAHFLVPLLECARRYSWRCTVTRDGRAVALVCSSDAVDMRETQLDLPPFRVFTADRLEAQVDCILYFRVVDAHAAVYNVVDLYGAISSIVETTLRSTVCKMRLDEAIAGIESIRRDIGGALAAREQEWGIKLTNFDLQSRMQSTWASSRSAVKTRNGGRSSCVSRMSTASPLHTS